MMDRESFNRHFSKLKKNMNSNKNLRSFLQGIQIYVQLKGLKLNIYAPSPDNRIIKNSKMQPNLSFDIDGFNIYISLFNDIQTSSLVAKITMHLKHIIMINQDK